jgi:hypothetical protein
MNSNHNKIGNNNNMTGHHNPNGWMATTTITSAINKWSFAVNGNIQQKWKYDQMTSVLINGACINFSDETTRANYIYQVFFQINRC